MRSPPKAEPTPPTAKPLKSILKKKTNTEPPPVVPPAEDPYRIQIDHRLGPPPRQDFNSGRPPAEPAMDIEDEERFLYGEAEKTETPTSKPPLWTQPFAAGLYQPRAVGLSKATLSRFSVSREHFLLLQLTFRKNLLMSQKDSTTPQTSLAFLQSGHNLGS